MSKLSKEDQDLFRDAVRGARPLERKSERVRPDAARPAPEPRQSEASERAVLDELLEHDIEPGQLGGEEGGEYLRAGLQQRVMRRLKRGQFTVGDEIDLHHMRVAEARRCLGAFLAEARSRGVHCVRVIHGKGRRSPGGEPVLRRFVAGYLRRHGDVLAYCAARRADGGSGALTVLLRR